MHISHNTILTLELSYINRMFPGYDAGETTQCIAHAVLEVTRPAHYRIDLHSASLDFEELP